MISDIISSLLIIVLVTALVFDRLTIRNLIEANERLLEHGRKVLETNDKVIKASDEAIEASRALIAAVKWRA